MSPTLLAVALLARPAAAQAVDAVPAGVRGVTVMLCDEPDGCAPAFQALSDDAAARGVPVLDFDAVAQDGPGGGAARRDWDAARAVIADPKARRDDLEAAREAQWAVPLTLPPGDPFALWLRLGDARLSDGDAAGASMAFSAAASSTAGRVHDLPPLSDAGLQAYLGATNRDAGIARLDIGADMVGVRVFVDGQPVGIAPLSVEVPAGWHRVTAERDGRRTAWTGEVTAPADHPLQVDVRVAADDSAAALEAAVIGVTRGQAADPAVASVLADWARDQGLDRVRFVRLTPPAAAGAVPAERIEGRTGVWDVHDAWLDVGARRLSPTGGSIAGMARRQRFTLGVSLGYARLQTENALGPDPHDHVTAEAVAQVRLAEPLDLDLRVGLYRSAQPYYLYRDWVSQELVPVALGLRWHPGHSGVYLGAHGRALIPYAIGGDGVLGWQWSPSHRWRLGLEAMGGYTDQGALFGGGLSAGFAG